jgi:hypothetical protein
MAVPFLLIVAKGQGNYSFFWAGVSTKKAELRENSMKG